MNTEQTVIAHKIKDVLVDVKLVAEAPSYVTSYARTKEREAERLEEWARELVEFIRDHRSRDGIQLWVERVRKDLCSECESEWETYDDNGKTCCASCGKEVLTP